MNKGKVKIALFFIIVFWGYRLATGRSTSPTDIFILAGQSNMAGRGGVNGNTWDGNVPPECQSDSRILRLNDGLVWEEAREPLHQNISIPCPNNGGKISGVGPGMPFANSLLKRDPFIGTIGLIPCAVGGTKIKEWQNDTCLYTRLLHRTRAALSGGSLRGMLWYQGESDVFANDSIRYGDRLLNFFNSLRSDLQSPTLPIIQVGLASGDANGDPNGKAIVRAAQFNLSLPNVVIVDADKLPLNGDNLHLTTDSQVRLGSKLADAYLQYFSWFK